MEAGSTGAKDGGLLSYDDLVARIARRLQAVCSALPGSCWQMEQDVDLKLLSKSDGEQVRQLLFGGVDEVHEAWVRQYQDGLRRLQQGTVQDQLGTLIKMEFSADIARYAEIHGLSVSAVTQRLERENAFGADALDIPEARLRYNYRGTVSLVAPTGLDLSFVADEPLFRSLKRLRVHPEAFLAACEALILDEQFSFDRPGPFGTSQTLAYAEDAGAQSLADAFKGCFMRAWQLSTDVALYEDLESHDEPVVDAAALVAAMCKWGAPSSSGSGLVYLHTACTGQLVENVSNWMARRGLSLAVTQLVVRDAVLALDTNPENLGTAIAIKGPISIPVRSFEVRPEDTVRVKIEPDLTEVLCIERQLHSLLRQIARQEVPHPHEQLSDQLSALAQRIPGFRCLRLAHLLGGLDRSMAQRPAQAIQSLLRAQVEAPLDDETRERGLFSCLGWSPVHGEYGRDQAQWLISKGANVNATLPNGVSPLMLAAHTCDAGMVAALLAAGAHVNASARDRLTGLEDNALSLAARALHKRRKPGLASVCVDLLLKAGAELPSSKLRSGHGGAIRWEPAAFAVVTGNQALLRRTMVSLPMFTPEAKKRQLDAALFAAGICGDREVGRALMDAGADLGGMVDLPESGGSTVQDALRTWAAARGQADAAAQFLASVHAYRARRAIASMAGAVVPQRSQLS